MESAIDMVTGEIIDAEQLWLIESVDKERYICRGCGAKAVPASFQPENVVRPYFRSTHNADCDVTGEAKLIVRGRQEKLGSKLTGFPAPYPSKLVLVDDRVVDDGGSGGEYPVPPRTRGGPRGRDSGPSDIQRKRSAGTIRPISRTFINYPYDRYLDLNVPGVDAKTYGQVFKKLKWDELVSYTDKKIFYAAMRWSVPLRTDDYLEVSLDGGEREAKKLVRPYRVRVAWGGWSKSKRTYVSNELEVARKDAISEAEKKTNKKAYLFFLGRQDHDDLTLFHVTDHRLICCLFDEIIWPKF
ncbi:hypothetical protein [Rugamonas rubra]|uniref:Uncharacterized protein n=1 Tax=Rugamonas rubra TaxID=758825 RepID=A0A1I4JB16_9BURK|nr:hypothetical protein [Rugamonas rubra]SFL63768.1 hypothetical protein SAMN02982985_00900 [Rugamonas rubra]